MAEKITWTDEGIKNALSDANFKYKYMWDAALEVLIKMRDGYEEQLAQTRSQVGEEGAPDTFPHHVTWTDDTIRIAAEGSQARKKDGKTAPIDAAVDVMKSMRNDYEAMLRVLQYKLKQKNDQADKDRAVIVHAAGDTVARRLREIAETGEHLGVFTHPEMEAAAQAILKLHAAKSNVATHLEIASALDRMATMTERLLETMKPSQSSHDEQHIPPGYRLVRTPTDPPEWQIEPIWPRFDAGDSGSLWPDAFKDT